MQFLYFSDIFSIEPTYLPKRLYFIDHKNKYYALRIEFQKCGSPHVHSFIWIFNAPNIRDEKNFIEFTENTLNAQLSEPENEPDLLEFAKNHPIHFH